MPGCRVADVVGAHIIPHELASLDENNEFRKQVFADAGFELAFDVDTPRNGMGLCRSHHISFDKYVWTLDASYTFRALKPEDELHATLEGMLLDFSHRPPAHIPSASIITARNKWFADGKGERMGTERRAKLNINRASRAGSVSTSSKGSRKRGGAGGAGGAGAGAGGASAGDAGAGRRRGGAANR